MLKKILPWYEKYSKQLLFSFWALFTLTFALLTIINGNNENHLFASIFIISLFGWIVIAIYLLLDHIFSHPDKTGENNPIISSKTTHYRILKILDIVYVALFISLLIILQTCTTRPLLYYILITILLGVLVTSILLTNSTITHGINIIKVLFFSALSTLAVFKQFYLAGPNDIGYFAALNEITAELGFIPVELAGKQMDQPLVHLMIAISKILINSDIQIASICAVVIPSILLTLCIYVIARHFVGNKYGLLAMLLSNIFADIICFRYQANPTEWAWIYYVVVLFALFLWIRSNGKLYNRFGILLLLFMGLTLFAHLFSSVTILLIILSLYIGSVLICGKIFTRLLPLVVMYSLMSALQWLFSGGINIILSAINAAITANRGEIPSIPSTTVLEKYIGVEPSSLFDYLSTEHSLLIIQCICLLLPLMLLASQSVLCKRDKNTRSYLYLIICALIAGLGFYSLVFAAYINMVCRIGCFVGVIFSMGLAFLFAEFSSRASSNKKKIVHCTFVVILVCSIGFLNLSMPLINDDTHLWDKDRGNSGLQYNEMISYNTIYDITSEENTLYINGNRGELIRYYSPLAYYNHKKMKYYTNAYSVPNYLKEISDYKPASYVLYSYTVDNVGRVSFRTHHGNSELKIFYQVISLDMTYLPKLSNSSQIIYQSGGVDKLYFIR